MSTNKIHDPAHKYGLDNMSASAALSAINQTILGNTIDTTNSWTGTLLPGQSGEITTIFSGGFTRKITIHNIDDEAAIITSTSIIRTDTSELLQEITGDIPLTFPKVGAALQNTNIYSGNDFIQGNSFNNILRGYGGNDKIDGDTGIDTAYFSGFASNYQITKTSNSTLSVQGIDGLDQLFNIERLQFDDKKLAFDTDGNAGQVAKIIGAVFGKDTLGRKDYVGIGLDLLDNGTSYSEVMELALNVKLGHGFSDAAEIKNLYQNLLGNQPTESDLNQWINTISSGQFTQNSLALMAAETGINSSNINLASLAKSGIEFAKEGSGVLLTGQNNIDSLLSNNKWGESIGTGANLTYSFRSNSSVYSTDTETGYGPADGSGEPWQAGWVPLLTPQIKGINASLDAWAEIANIRFTEVIDSPTVTGEIRFSTLPEVTDSSTFLPEPSERAGDVWLSTSNELNTSTKGTFGFTTFLRETGHALGLDHPQEGRITADSSIDALPFTIMSERNFVGDSLNNNREILFPTTPMLNDIAAIQYLYGANLNTRSDDTTYSWEPDQIIYETIWDGGGNDTIDWSNQSTAAIIDLNEGKWSFLGPKRWDGQTNTNQNLAIANNAIIENATGGVNNDILTGNDDANFLNGGDGDDELHGGAGADFFDWDENFRDGDDSMYGGLGNDTYVVNSLSDTIIELPGEGIDVIFAAETYSIAEIENVENLFLFGSRSINATGNALANTLRGNTQDNLLDAGEDNDILIGLGGNDILDGQAGMDTAVYQATKDSYTINTSNPNWSITINIDENTVETDTLTSIERLQFTDVGIAFDMDGNAGEVAKIIGSVFGKDTLERKDYVGIGLNLFDNGTSYSEIMELALHTRLGVGFSDTAEIELFYQNLLGTLPTEDELNFWVNTISSGQFTQTTLAKMATDTDFNTTNIDLIGLTQAGVEFI